MPFGTPPSAAKDLRAFLVASLVVASIASAGCGDGRSGSTEPQRLSAAEASAFDQGRSTIYGYCRKLALYLAHRRGPPSSADSQQALAAADQLIELTRAKPDALYRGQDPLRLLLDDLAEDLEGTNCGAAIEHRLDEALAALPP
jgi:hypothetical protein